MPNDNLLTLFPQRKIRPYDGMPVTADVWDEAHSFHDQAQRAHNLFFHGAGVLVGMDVVASDPPDQMVYILPGAAVDPNGQLIVLAEPVAYDLGADIDGQLYLFISYRRSIRSQRSTEGDTSPEYAEDKFSIAASPSLPDRPAVELARFRRENRAAPIRDAGDPLHPRAGEIDQRYRHLIPLRSEGLVSAAVVYLGNNGVEKDLGAGLSRVSAELRHTAHLNLIVDDGVEFSPEILGYTLVCLAASGSFQTNQAQIKGLKGFLERGGTLFLEYSGEPARSCFEDLCAQLGFQPQPIPRSHPLLAQPYLFSAPPPGEVEGELMMVDGIILSGKGYGKSWAGNGPEEPASRERIRTLVEWAANLLTYAVERRSAG